MLVLFPTDWSAKFCLCFAANTTLALAGCSSGRLHRPDCWLGQCSDIFWVCIAGWHMVGLYDWNVERNERKLVCYSWLASHTLPHTFIISNLDDNVRRHTGRKLNQKCVEDCLLLPLHRSPAATANNWFWQSVCYTQLQYISHRISSLAGFTRLLTKSVWSEIRLTRIILKI